MQKGRGGMGSHKHGTSGRAPKSPKMRMAMRLEARKNERQPRKREMKPSLNELLYPRNPKMGDVG